MSEWEDDCMDTRKKKLADEHRCMKRWVDECDKIKVKPQGSLIQNETNQKLYKTVIQNKKWYKITKNFKSWYHLGHLPKIDE